MTAPGKSPRRLTPEQQALVAQWRGLVAKVVRSIFAGNTNADAMGEGQIGLCYAAMRFDESHGVKFSTYASYWIRAFVMKELMLQKCHDLPHPTTKEERKVFFGMGRARRRLYALGIDPTDETVAKQLSVPVQAVSAIRAKLMKPVQLDHLVLTVNVGGNADLPIQLPSPDESPEDAVSSSEALDDTTRRLRQLLSLLSDRERLILRRRWLSEKPRTLEQVGAELNISRERVRQIEKVAIGKLRAWMRRDA